MSSEKSLEKIKAVIPTDDWSEDDYEHYRTIVEALESRTPTLTAKLNIGEGIYMEVCPVCNSVVSDKGTDLYCRKCGQALKWDVQE